MWSLSFPESNPDSINYDFLWREWTTYNSVTERVQDCKNIKRNAFSLSEWAIVIILLLVSNAMSTSLGNVDQSRPNQKTDDEGRITSFLIKKKSCSAELHGSGPRIHKTLFCSRDERWFADLYSFFPSNSAITDGCIEIMAKLSSFLPRPFFTFLSTSSTYPI